MMAMRNAGNAAATNSPPAQSAEDGANAVATLISFSTSASSPPRSNAPSVGEEEFAAPNAILESPVKYRGMVMTISDAVAIMTTKEVDSDTAIALLDGLVEGDFNLGAFSELFPDLFSPVEDTFEGY